MSAHQGRFPATHGGWGPIVGVFLGGLLAVSAAAAEPTGKDEKEQREQHRGFLDSMRSLAETTNVRYAKGDRQPKLVSSPVFRYDDQPRRFLDATLWVWTEAGRPVAFEKIEAMAQDQPKWGYCFTSVAEGLLTVKWGDGREFRSTSPGVDFQPLAGAPPPPERGTARKLEARKLYEIFPPEFSLTTVPTPPRRCACFPHPSSSTAIPKRRCFEARYSGSLRVAPTPIY